MHIRNNCWPMTLILFSHENIQKKEWCHVGQCCRKMDSRRERNISSSKAKLYLFVTCYHVLFEKEKDAYTRSTDNHINCWITKSQTSGLYMKREVLKARCKMYVLLLHILTWKRATSLSCATPILYIGCGTTRCTFIFCPKYEWAWRRVMPSWIVQPSAFDWLDWL